MQWIVLLLSRYKSIEKQRKVHFSGNTAHIRVKHYHVHIMYSWVASQEKKIKNDYSEILYFTLSSSEALERFPKFRSSLTQKKTRRQMTAPAEGHHGMDPAGCV